MHAVVVAVGEGKLININILLFTTRSQQATTTITKHFFPKKALGHMIDKLNPNGGTLHEKYFFT